MADLAGLRIWLGRWNLTVSVERDDPEPRILGRPDCIELPELDEDANAGGVFLGFR